MSSATREVSSTRGTTWDHHGTTRFLTGGPGLTAGNNMAIGRKKVSWTTGTTEKETSPSEGSKFGSLVGETRGPEGANVHGSLYARDSGPSGPSGPTAPNSSGSLTEGRDHLRDHLSNQMVPPTNRQANQQAWDPALPVPVQEILGLPVRQLAELPIPSTLTLRIAGFSRPVVVTVSGRRHRTLTADGWAVFAPGELSLLVAALEAQRALPADVLEWCKKKLEIPGGWRLTSEAAFGRGVPSSTASGWTFGRLLDELAGRIVAIELELEDQTTEAVWAERPEAP